MTFMKKTRLILKSGHQSILCFVAVDMAASGQSSLLLEMEALRARVQALELELGAKPTRGTTSKMEEIVVDSNPYR